MESSVILFRRANMKPIFKRLLSGVLSATMTVSATPIISAHAEESAEPYPYTMFAASSGEGAITVNAGNLCVNGNVATNGTIVSSGNMNINGTRTEHADESMLYVLKKLNYSYFSSENVETYTEDYILEDLNIGQPTLSHHMKILCDAGIVSVRKEGKWMHYSLNREGFARASEILASFYTSSAEYTLSAQECSCSKNK